MYGCTYCWVFTGLLLLSFNFLCPPVIFSQKLPQEDPASAGLTLYQIKLSRVKRLLQSGIDVKVQNGPEIESFVREAMLMADEQLYDIAVEFLQSAIDLMEMTPEAATEMEPNAPPVDDTETSWDLAVLSGAEIWRQQFDLVYGDTDSTIRDDQTNPYAGVRLHTDYRRGDSFTVDACIDGKLSQEYHALISRVELLNAFSPALRLRLVNDLDRYAYQQQSGFNYTDNSLEAGLFYRIRQDWELSLENDFEIRRYDHTDFYFPGYLQNHVLLGAEYRLPALGRLRAILGNRVRNYDKVPERDYQEWSFDLRLWPDAYSRFSISNLFSLDLRTYPHGFVDTLYTNDYTGFYNLTDFSYTLYGQTNLKCRAEFESRTYRESVTSMPDFLDYSIEPGIEFGIMHSITMQAGYRFRNRLHESLATSAESVNVEDYFTHGPVITLDLFFTNGLMASISNSYQLQRYPNYASFDESGFSLYSNRNINSVFFFLTWELGQRFELSSMGMLDYDTNQDIKGANTISNLLNFELLYKF